MAKTFGELVMECQNFEYSKENYDLMKECYEVALMRHYVESQQFMIDNMADIREYYQGFDESYFGEAAGESTLQEIKEAADTKSDSIIKRIWEGIKNLLSKIVGFFTRIGESFKRVLRNTKKAKEKMDNAPPELIGVIAGNTNQEDINNVEEPSKKVMNTEKEAGQILIDELIKAGDKYFTSNGLTVQVNQSFRSRLRDFYAQRGTNRYGDLLAVALSDDYVEISTTDNQPTTSINFLQNVFNCFLTGDDSADELNDRINFTIDTWRNKPQSINVSYIDEDIQELKAFESKLTSMINGEMALNGGTGGPLVRDNKLNMDPDKWRNVYMRLNQLLATSMKLYTAINSFRDYMSRFILDLKFTLEDPDNFELTKYSKVI